MTRSGLIIVDKPAGLTSHDVVARIRRIAGTRRVGHAGTLDPMATGVLVVGVERATRLLTYLVGADKRYSATVRFGQTTVTDDAEGEITESAPAATLTEQALPEAAIRAALVGQIGEIDQVPSAVSAIKVRGVRSYARVRAGQEVELPPRKVTVHRLAVAAVRRAPDWIDVDVDVECSSGTYIRAIARDAGATVGVGGHLVALRRTAVGEFTAGQAVALADLANQPDPVTISLAEAAGRCLTRRGVTVPEAGVLAHGGRLAATGVPGPVAAFDPTGQLIAIVVDQSGQARPAVVFAPA